MTKRQASRRLGAFPRTAPGVRLAWRAPARAGVDAGGTRAQSDFGAKGTGWYSFDAGGVHFIGLVNVANLKAGGMGSLGGEQLAWLAADLKGKPASTPIVVFAHIPLWAVYPEWGWGTEDSANALALLKRFGSVTVLNGHIHQPLSRSPRQEPPLPPDRCWCQPKSCALCLE